jgi:hypothetical protein
METSSKSNSKAQSIDRSEPDNLQPAFEFKLENPQQLEPEQIHQQA